MIFVLYVFLVFLREVKTPTLILSFFAVINSFDFLICLYHSPGMRLENIILNFNLYRESHITLSWFSYGFFNPGRIGILRCCSFGGRKSVDFGLASLFTWLDLRSDCQIVGFLLISFFVYKIFYIILFCRLYITIYVVRGCWLWLLAILAKDTRKKCMITLIEQFCCTILIHHPIWNDIFDEYKEH